MVIARRLLIALTVVVVAASCSASSGDDASTVGDEGTGTPVPAWADGEERSDGAGSEGVAGDSPSPGAPAPGAVGGVEVVPVDLDTTVGADRRIAYRGSIASTVIDVDAALTAARAAVAAEGGFLFGQQASSESATVIFKVPSVGFDAAFDALAAVGTVTDRRVEADDVTAQLVDLESRRRTLATSIDRLRGFLADAASVDEITRLESELARREAEHDVIAGQLRALDARTVLATITTVFTLDPDEVPPVDDGDDGGPPGFLAGLAAGWDAARVIADAGATAVGYALPFSPLAVLALAGIRWWRRRTPPVVVS